jgi:hypothetical protein
VRAGESVEDLEKYREWLRVRGVENASRDEARRLKEQACGSPYGSLLDFLLLVWIDSRGKYAGTRGWLRAQGLLEPSDEDLRYFSQKVKQAVLRRALVVLLVVIAWFAFAHVTGLKLAWYTIVMGISLAICGLGMSAGTRLAGNDRAARRNARWTSQR